MKSLLRNVIRSCGYEVSRIDGKPKGGKVGSDPFRETRRILRTNSQIVAFDVGANTGQTILKLRATFPHPTIHAFEPGASAFDELRSNFKTEPGLTLNNFALGSVSGEQVLFEYTSNKFNSLLAPGPDNRQQVVKRGAVRLLTLDDYCSACGVEQIDLLKTDTQGFDLEVLRGGRALASSGRIRAVLTEVNFVNLYDGQANYGELMSFLDRLGFAFISFYGMRFRNNRAAWADALFIHESSLKQTAR